ncbi:hypothetical protein E4T66_18055 [Sinimarinibacterium sp. CAU 1509]|uniref:UvrD-helicase domain-containing protein n=1 Tax=Sinimarinibacterium sp. CAU 1509 TaxID=2562283 RepID=UPI0010AB5A9B|nr:UvrD-helicase domain-containing protein [Sinimarinibacterium sp. CAU 1509]TJY57310.1 hypothetical protein E4T66_18055 [Sinimarinibacterium sp. CAU 1509]
MNTNHDTLISADAAARAIAIDVTRSVMVKAPAGSGKTTLLAQRMLAALATVNDPEEVLAITFTNKAANEMRARVLDFLQRAADGVEPTNDSERVTAQLAGPVLARDQERGWDVLRNPSRLRIMTIDSLNSFLAGLAPIVSGLGGGVGIEERPARLYRDAVIALVDEMDELAEDSDDRQALTRLLAYSSNRVESLIPLLRSMLARRDQWMALVMGRVSDSDAMVAASHAALAELAVSRVERVRGAAWSGHLADIAAAAHDAGLLEEAGLPDAYTHDIRTYRTLAGLCLTKTGGLRKRLTASEGFPAGKVPTVCANAALAALRERTDEADIVQALRDVEMLPDLDALDGADGFALDLSRVLYRLCAHLQVVFQRAGAIDFVEMSMRALSTVTGAGGQIPLAERMDYLISHILLDEAQDTSAAQYGLLLALTGAWTPDDARSVFIVGDPQQSIYSFREAEVRLFVELWQRRTLGDISLETVELAANFRSRAGIIEFCNEMFSRSFPTDDDLFAGSVSYAPSVAMRGEGGVVDLELINGEAGETEAQRAALIAADLIARSPDESIAVLVRNRADVRRIVEAFKLAGVPYSCQDIDPLAKSDAVRDVVGMIRALWHYGDRVAWGTLLRAPWVGLSWSDFLVLTKGRTHGSLDDAIRAELMGSSLSDEGRARLNRLTAAMDAARRDAPLAGNLADFAEAVWLALGGPACVSLTEAEDVRQVFALLRESLIGGQLESPEAFSEALAGLYAAAGAGRVQIMTIHKAKGLEFDHVLLAGLWRAPRNSDAPLLAYRHTEHGLLLAPAVERSGDEAHEAYYKTILAMNRRAADAEALRVLYVAATRARERLVIFGAVSTSDSGYFPPRGSMLDKVWPSLATRVAGITAHAGQDVPEPPRELEPLSPRLPVDWECPLPLLGYVPPESKVVSPSELVVRESLGVGAAEDGVYERVVGTCYHELMERVAKRGGPDQFDEVLNKAKAPLAASMRHRGMPEPRLMEAMARVIELARRTVTGVNGRRILSATEGARSEERVAGYVDGEWVSAIIDRCFVEGGRCVQIDYKTSGAGVSDAEWDAFVASEVAIYGRQQRLYAQVLEGAARMPVDAYLYFPERDFLATVPM